jgi:hypothetical protein
MKSLPPPDKKWLIEEYINKKRSCYDIAKELQRTPVWVVNWLHKYQIQIQYHRRKVPIQIQKLRRARYAKIHNQNPEVKNRILQYGREQYRIPNSFQKYDQRRKKNSFKVKVKVIMAYGGKCVCCEETELDFLTIDHINNNGKIHRLEVNSGLDLYRWLIKHNYPSEFQLLCWNCNEGKQFNNGACCPHQQVHKIFSSLQAKRNLQLKLEAYQKFGSKCQCCGVQDHWFLTFDHINNDGRIWRETKTIIIQLYRWIVNGKSKSVVVNCDPHTILQLYCWNCNNGKRLNGGICAHQSLNSNRFDFPLI